MEEWIDTQIDRQTDRQTDKMLFANKDQSLRFLYFQYVWKTCAKVAPNFALAWR